MRHNPPCRNIRYFWLLILPLMAGALPGCIVVRHVSEFCTKLTIRHDEAHELKEIRRDVQQDLAAEREAAMKQQAEQEVLRARHEAERRQWEREFCAARQEAELQALRSNMRENLQSKLAFRVDQGLEVGELKVDMEKLKKLIKEREEAPPTQPLRYPGKTPCKCCDVECGCAPGLIRRHCSKCCRKPCDAEDDCGGPEALRHLASQPLRNELRPTEIPLMLPVKLRFGMQNPEIETARIVHEPLIDTPPNEPCTHNPPRCHTPPTRNPTADLPPNGIPPEPMVERSETFPAKKAEALPPAKPEELQTNKPGMLPSQYPEALPSKKMETVPSNKQGPLPANKEDVRAANKNQESPKQDPDSNHAFVAPQNWYPAEHLESFRSSSVLIPAIYDIHH